MKFATFALIAAAGLAPFGASAALSGYFDSAEQIQTILGSTELAERFSQQRIEGIDFEGVAADGTFEWEVETESCTAEVYLRAIPPAGVGKTTYEVARIDGCR